jgi:hypothetical protein
MSSSHNFNENTRLNYYTIVIDIPDIYLQNFSRQKYTNVVNVIITPPRKIGRYQETNPFSFTIETTPLVNNPGEISISSSITIDNVLFQYWTCRTGSDRNRNTTFSCSLTNNRADLAAAYNLVTVYEDIAPNLPMANTRGMANGTKMSGIFYKNGGALINITGNTTDMYHPFAIQISVPRPRTR